MQQQASTSHNNANAHCRHDTKYNQGRRDYFSNPYFIQRQYHQTRSQHSQNHSCSYDYRRMWKKRRLDGMPGGESIKTVWVCYHRTAVQESYRENNERWERGANACMCSLRLLLE